MHSILEAAAIDVRDDQTAPDAMTNPLSLLQSAREGAKQ